jgi:hypothetical protein
VGQGVRRGRVFDVVFDRTATLDQTQPNTSFVGSNQLILGGRHQLSSTNESRIVLRWPLIITNLLHVELDTDVRDFKIQLTVGAKGSSGWTNQPLERVEVHPLLQNFVGGFLGQPPTFASNPTWSCPDDLVPANGEKDCVGNWNGASQSIINGGFNVIDMTNGPAGTVVALDANQAFVTNKTNPFVGFLVNTQVVRGSAGFHSHNVASTPDKPTGLLELDMCCWDVGCTIGFMGAQGTCACALPLMVDDGILWRGLSRCDNSGAVPKVIPNPQYHGSELAQSVTLRTPVIVDGWFRVDLGGVEINIDTAAGGFIAVDTLHTGGGVYKINATVSGAVVAPQKFILGHFNVRSGLAPRGAVYYNGYMCNAGHVTSFEAGNATYQGKSYLYSLILNFDPAECPVPSATTGVSTGIPATSTGTTTGTPAASTTAEVAAASTSSEAEDWLWLIILLVCVAVVLIIAAIVGFVLWNKKNRG